MPPVFAWDMYIKQSLFSDGKLIFELSHRKEGERASWVPVPKKTYWPPPGGGGVLPPAVAAIAGPSRQESSASLSGET